MKLRVTKKNRFTIKINIHFLFFITRHPSVKHNILKRFPKCVVPTVLFPGTQASWPFIEYVLAYGEEFEINDSKNLP